MLFMRRPCKAEAEVEDALPQAKCDLLAEAYDIKGQRFEYQRQYWHCVR